MKQPSFLARKSAKSETVVKFASIVWALCTNLASWSHRITYRLRFRDTDVHFLVSRWWVAEIRSAWRQISHHHDQVSNQIQSEHRSKDPEKVFTSHNLRIIQNFFLGLSNFYWVYVAAQQPADKKVLTIWWKGRNSREIIGLGEREHWWLIKSEQFNVYMSIRVSRGNVRRGNASVTSNM